MRGHMAACAVGETGVRLAYGFLPFLHIHIPLEVWGVPWNGHARFWGLVWWFPPLLNFTPRF